MIEINFRNDEFIVGGNIRWKICMLKKQTNEE